MGSIAVLDMLGGVALLLWGLRMVRSGIMRAFEAELRRLLSRALSNRFLALLAGIGVTALLQSSTATGLMMTSFAARPRRSRPSVGGHARRQHRHDVDRSSLFIRHFGRRADPVRSRFVGFQPRRSHTHP
jgi:hypothetical protein